MEKLTIIRKYTYIIEKFEKVKKYYEKYQKEKDVDTKDMIYSALQRVVEEVLESSIKLNIYILKEKGKFPKSYKESFELLKNELKFDEEKINTLVSLREFNPSNDEGSTIYESIAIPDNPYTRLEGFLAACESEDGRRFVVQKSGEVFLDEAHPSGLMKRIGLPKSLELAIFKRAMRICREQISGTLRDNNWGSQEWSSYDSKKQEGWEKFLELYSKYKDVFPTSVWEIQDIINSSYPYQKTPKVTFKPFPYKDAYEYFESQLGEDCKRHAEFHRSQNRGNLEGGAIDYAIEAVLGNMIEYALHKHRPNAVAHLEDSIYLGTQSGRIIRLSDEIDSRKMGMFSTKTYDNGLESLRQNTNGGYWTHNNYSYPVGWAQGVDIKLPTKSQKQIPITAICTISQEVYEDFGIRQRVNNLRRNSHYFANKSKGVISTASRKAA